MFRVLILWSCTLGIAADEVEDWFETFHKDDGYYISGCNILSTPDRPASRDYKQHLYSKYSTVKNDSKIKQRYMNNANAFTTISSLWPKGIVPVVISITNNQQAKDNVVKALGHWEESTCIRFASRSNEADYVEYIDGGECSSSIGRQGGRQVVRASDSCGTFGVMVHETGHVLGLHHTQQRRDRDDYVVVDLNQVAPQNQQFNFNIYPVEESANVFQYDYGSIMHYAASAFAIGSQPVIIAPFRIGQREQLSPIDVQTVNFMYGNCAKTSQATCTVSYAFGTTPYVIDVGERFHIEFTGFAQSETSTSAIQAQVVSIPAGATQQQISQQGFIITAFDYTPTADSVGVVTFSVAYFPSDTTIASNQCSFAVQVVPQGQGCLGRLRSPTDCSGHGTCGSKTFPCECSSGYVGSNCEFEVSQACPSNFPINVGFDVDTRPFIRCFGCDVNNLIDREVFTSGTGSLRCPSPSGGYYGMGLDFDTLIAVTEIRYNMYIQAAPGTKLNGAGKVDIYSEVAKDSSGNIVRETIHETIQITSGGGLIVSPDAVTPTEFTVTPNQWYQVRILLNYTSRTTQVFINEAVVVRLCEWSYLSSFRGVARITLGNQASGTTTYFDDFKAGCIVRATTASPGDPPTNPEGPTEAPVQVAQPITPPTNPISPTDQPLSFANAPITGSSNGKPYTVILSSPVSQINYSKVRATLAGLIGVPQDFIQLTSAKTFNGKTSLDFTVLETPTAPLKNSFNLDAALCTPSAQQQVGLESGTQVVSNGAPLNCQVQTTPTQPQNSPVSPRLPQAPFRPLSFSPSSAITAPAPASSSNLPLILGLAGGGALIVLVVLGVVGAAAVALLSESSTSLRSPTIVSYAGDTNERTYEQDATAFTEQPYNEEEYYTAASTKYPHTAYTEI